MTDSYTNYSQYQKILTLMCRYRDKHWWFPYDFMLPEQGSLFVGYEASARLSELASKYPDMIESERSGKYIRRRIRFETMAGWLNDLPKDLRYVFHRTGQSKGVQEPVKPKPKTVPTKPLRQMAITATYRGRGAEHKGMFGYGKPYELVVERLALGNPVRVVKPIVIEYRNLAAFQKEWRAL